MIDGSKRSREMSLGKFHTHRIRLIVQLLLLSTTLNNESDDLVVQNLIARLCFHTLHRTSDANRTKSICHCNVLSRGKQESIVSNFFSLTDDSERRWLCLSGHDVSFSIERIYIGSSVIRSIRFDSIGFDMTFQRTFPMNCHLLLKR